MAFALRSTRSAAADMNITPLADVMLVPLVVFMVAAPVVNQHIPFDLPQAGPTMPAPGARIRLQVDDAGEVRWDGRLVPASQLAGLLQIEAGRARHPRVEIEATPDAPYARVIDVLASARNAGLEGIGLASP